MKDKKTFYYVYNPKQGKPNYQHDNFESAKQEAQRLAQSSNDEFFVLAVCYSIKRQIFDETTYSDIPF